MASPLRSPVFWILTACVLVILGITLLFELQEPDTDWRRKRWAGSKGEPPAPDEAPGEGSAEEPPADAPARNPEPRPPGRVEQLTATNDLTSLRAFLKKRKSTNDDIIAYLRAVAAACNKIAPPGPPAPDAPDAERAAHEQAVKRHAADQADFNRLAEKIILECLGLVKLSRDKESNLRSDVNRSAALVISNLAPGMTDDQRRSFSAKLMKSLDRLAKAKYTVNAERLEAGFAALGSMRWEASLEWMAEGFIHTKNSDDQIVRMIAAHKAMVMFPYAETPGKLRYRIVKQLVGTYSGTETQAQQGGGFNAAQTFWSRVGPGVIRVVQHFAGVTASHPGGEPFTRVNDFSSWFRDHKNAKKAPWGGR